MSDLSQMTLEQFRMWTDNSLKAFLSVRNKSVEGTSEELSARAFAAWEENIRVDGDAEHRLRANLAEYKAKLTIDGVVIPDPFGLQDGWLDESDDNRKHWPQIFFSDIADFLRLRSSADLLNRLCNEYKQGKAYRYFAAGWVDKVSYHEIHLRSNICFLASSVRPSMSIRNQPYRAWVAVEKNKPSTCGGKVYEGYCTCPAGLQGSCNHVAGLLFRVEHAVRTGLVDVSCTSQLCQWNMPSTKQVFSEPQPVSALEWTRKHYSKQNRQPGDSRSAARQLFSTSTASQQISLSDHNSTISRMAAFLEVTNPDCCFVQLYRSKPFERPPRILLPKTIGQMFEDLGGASLDEKVAALTVSDADIMALSEATSQQHMSDLWIKHRQYRITATKFKAVMSYMSPENKPRSDYLIKSILGVGRNVQTAAMKHGISMEPHAADKYRQVMKAQHKQFKAVKTGLVLYKPHPYIAASPDLLIECKCHGKGLCEIKCPYSNRHLTPNAETVLYLENVNGTCRLKRSHEYFYQIQGQMGITGRNYCDFFVYTVHGYHCERIVFETGLWQSIVDNCIQFWTLHIAPQIGLQLCVTSGSDTDTADEQDVTVAAKSSDHSYNHRKKDAGPLVKPPYPIVNLCGVCRDCCSTDDTHLTDTAVQCSQCMLWYHLKCVNMPVSDECWMCDDCLMK